MFRSADEALTDYKGKLGEEFGTAYYHAHSEWCDLWLTWKQFRNLFCSGPERVDLLNRCGSGFFYRVDKIFLEATLLAICRLTDKEIMFGNKNLTVHAFRKFMDSEIRKYTMDELLKEVDGAASFARDWRNRRISHNDYALIIGEAKPLEGVTIDSISASIGSLHKVFSYISVDFMKTDTADEVIDSLNNEMVTLDRLFSGDAEFQIELNDLEQGRPYEKTKPKWLVDPSN